jgi:hypothetical protein
VTRAFAPAGEGAEAKMKSSKRWFVAGVLPAVLLFSGYAAA